MKGLVVLVASADAARFRAALSLALAQAAASGSGSGSGGAVELYCHEESIALLASAPRADDDGARLAAVGLPDRLQLLAMAREAGIVLTACQTGLALSGLSIDALVEGVVAGGMMGVVVGLGDARLVVF